MNLYMNQGLYLVILSHSKCLILSLYLFRGPQYVDWVVYHTMNPDSMIVCLTTSLHSSLCQIPSYMEVYLTSLFRLHSSNLLFLKSSSLILYK